MLLFLKILFTEFIAEMGDKTQLMLVAMTSKFKIRDIVIGTAAAVLVLNGLAVLAGGLVGSLIPDWLIKLIAATAFLTLSLRLCLSCALILTGKGIPLKFRAILILELITTSLSSAGDKYHLLIFLALQFLNFIPNSGRFLKVFC